MLAQSLGVRSRYKSLIWGSIALWGSIVGNDCVPMIPRICIYSEHCTSNALVTASEGSQNVVIVAYERFIRLSSTDPASGQTTHGGYSL